MVWFFQGLSQPPPCTSLKHLPPRALASAQPVAQPGRGWVSLEGVGGRGGSPRLGPHPPWSRASPPQAAADWCYFFSRVIGTRPSRPYGLLLPWLHFMYLKPKNQQAEPGWPESPVAAPTATLQQDRNTTPCPCGAQDCPSQPPNCLGAAEGQLLSPSPAVLSAGGEFSSPGSIPGC